MVQFLEKTTREKEGLKFTFYLSVSYHLYPSGMLLEEKKYIQSYIKFLIGAFGSFTLNVTTVVFLFICWLYIPFSYSPLLSTCIQLLLGFVLSIFLLFFLFI